MAPSVGRLFYVRHTGWDPVAPYLLNYFASEADATRGKPNAVIDVRGVEVDLIGLTPSGMRKNHVVDEMHVYPPTHPSHLPLPSHLFYRTPPPSGTSSGSAPRTAGVLTSARAEPLRSSRPGAPRLRARRQRLRRCRRLSRRRRRRRRQALGAAAAAAAAEERRGEARRASSRAAGRRKPTAPTRRPRTRRRSGPRPPPPPTRRRPLARRLINWRTCAPN